MSFCAAGEKMEKEFLETQQGVDLEIQYIMTAAEARMKQTSPNSIWYKNHHTKLSVTTKGKTAASKSNDFPMDASPKTAFPSGCPTGTSPTPLTAPELSQCQHELMNVLGSLRASMKTGSYSYTFGGDKDTSGKKKQSKGKRARRSWFWTSGSQSKKEPCDDNDSLTEDSSTGTAHTLESHEHDEEVSTILNHIESAKMHRSFRYQLGDGVPNSSQESRKHFKEYQECPLANCHLSVQEEALKRAMAKRYQFRKNSFWFS